MNYKWIKDAMDNGFKTKHKNTKQASSCPLREEM